MPNYKKLLITGTAGFIGYHTTKKMVDLGYEVVGLDNINDYYDVNLKYARLNELGIEREGAEKFNEFVGSSKYESLRFVRMNLEDRNEIERLFKDEGFDAVIHLAAQPGVRYSLENPHAYIDSNIVGFLNILEGCRHNNIKHLVYASSSSVYGANAKIPFSEEDRVDHPVSLYAATKKSNELMAYTYSHLYDIPTSGLRFFTVYGPWGRPDMAPMLFANAIANDKPINVFNHGDMSRDFTYIDDIVEGIHITLQNPPVPPPPPSPSRASGGGGGIGTESSTQTPTHHFRRQADRRHSKATLLNIGNGSPVHLMHFIETLEKEMGKKAKKDMKEMQPGDVPRTWADSSQLQALGYKSTTDIEKGVREFVEWFKNRFIF